MTGGDQRFFFLDLTKIGVQGGCDKAKHIGWLELNDWSFTMHTESKPNAKGGQPTKTNASGSFSFSITHNGPSLLKYAATSSHLEQPITFHALRGGIKQTPTAGQLSTGVYLELLFNQSTISGRSLGGDDGQKTEHIDISFEMVTMTYYQVIDGVLQGPLKIEYNTMASTANQT
jgi:type VI protein secretion system component Hcp